VAGRAIRNTARVIFFICGLVSLFTCVPYALLRGVDLPVESEWIAFVAVLGPIGLCSLTVAVLSNSRLARIGKMDWQDARLFATPLKLLGFFAALAYLIALFAYLAPHRWNLDPQLMLILCPMYFLKMTFDPSPTTTLFLLAPMNAAVFGSLGLTLSYGWMVLQRRESNTAA
jgi:hypothetical protein